MKKSDYGLLFVVAVLFFSLLATLQREPGYMDAEYYFGQSIQLVQHHTLAEPFIWNYLNDPTGLPVPGFAFWLPATSFIAAGGLWIFGTTSFFAAKAFFILMAASIALMAAFFANLFLPERRAGWLAGLLTLFSGFYLPFITITDTFTPYMFLGGLFFVCIYLAEKRSNTKTKIDYWFIFIGIVAGIMSLTRSDGLLWLAGGWLGVILINGIAPKNLKKSAIHVGLVLLGFAVVMTPWYMRNITIYHALYPPGNGLMPWLKKYDDLFVYPSSMITISLWGETGIGNIVIDRLKAMGSNLQTLIASGGVILLTPMMVIGFWKERKRSIIKMALVMLSAMLAIMTLVFPYAGERGGFFHSLSAVQVILWSLVPIGLNTIIQWGVQHRSWKTDRSWKMFGTALVVAAALFSAFIFTDKLKNGVESGIPWNQTQAASASVEERLFELTGDHNDMIMVNDPPGYTLATGRPSIMTPSGGANAIIDAGKRYDAHFLVINAERTDVQSQMDENALLAEHIQFLFETAGNKVYEFKP